MSTLPLENSHPSHDDSESVLCLNNYYIHNLTHRNTQETDKEITMQPNAIYFGDCKDVLADFEECSIDLIYVDPPFFSNKPHEIFWNDPYELRAYNDRWKGGRHGVGHYITWMEPRMQQCYRVLKDTGTMYLHCDWYANAHLRILMDRIFGQDNFRNEIIWYYRGGGVPKNGFAKRHDTILRYTKSNKCTFNTDDVRDRYSKDSLERLQYVARAFRGKKIYDKYRPNPKGKHPDDVWSIQPTMPSSKERWGYPTQKPERRLLERIVLASSNPMDIVLDPMCGCGTAISVAYRLGRRWIGIDFAKPACKIMVRRMQKLGIRITENDIIGLPKSIKELKALSPFVFQNYILQELHARPSKTRVRDYGVDGWLMDGRPIQIKQSEKIGRITVDKFETAVRRQHKKAGMIVAFSFTKDAYQEVDRARSEEDLEIELKTVEELVEDLAPRKIAPHLQTIIDRH